jgi:hypothetical protein
MANFCNGLAMPKISHGKTTKHWDFNENQHNGP